jgi:hypothetical protein
LAVVEEKRRKRVLLKKITVGVLLLVVVALMVLLLNINTIARIGTNTALNHYLIAGGELEAVDVRLLEGRVTLSGLVINPPPGFEPRPLLSLDVLNVDVAPWALFKGKVVIENLVVKGLSLNIIRNKKGQLSPLGLMAARDPGPEHQTENQPIEETPPWIPMVHAQAIQVEDVSFRLADRMLEKDWSASLNAGLNVEGLRIEDLLNLDILVGRVDLKLNDILVNQPPGFSREPFLAVNRIEIASQDIDLSTSGVPVSDVSLDTLSASLERNAEKEINLLKLIASWLPAKEEGENAASEGALVKPEESTGPEFKIPNVVVDNIRLNAISAQLLDNINGQPWRAGFNRMDIGITDVEVGDLSKMAVSLTSLDMGLRGIAVDQPPGFSKEPLLAINKIDVSSSGIDLGRSKVGLSDVMLDTLSVSLERNADQEINLMKIAESWLPVKDKNQNEILAPSSTTPTESSGPVFEIPVVVVDNIQLNSISAQLLDSMDGQPWRAGFDGLNIQVKGATVADLARQAISLASLDLALKGVSVDQPPGFSETPLLAMDRLTLASQGIDLGEAKVSISDVTLDSLSASLERNADREINLMKIAGAWLPENKVDDGSQIQPISPPSLSSERGLKLPSLVVDNVKLNSIKAQFLDSIDGQPWQAGFDGMGIEIGGVRVEDVTQQAVSLASLNLNLNGLTVQQLPGFSETPLLSMDNFKLVSREIDLGESKASIADISLNTLSASLERNTKNELNLIKLKEAWLPDVKDNDKETPAQSADPTRSSGPALKIPFVEVDRIQLNSISAQLLASIEDQPWRAGFDDLDILVTGVDAKAKPEQAVSLASFDLDLKSIKVDQPPGFNDRKLFGLERVTIISEKPLGPGEELVLEEVHLQGLTSYVTMRADGMTNLKVLSDALTNKEEEAGRPKAEKGAEKGAASVKFNLQPVLLKHFSLDGGPVTYRDEVFTEENLEANLDEINLDVRGLRLFAEEKDVEPAPVSISFELAQPGELPTAYFGALAKVGPVGDGVPMVNTQVRLVGLKLDTLGSLVPKRTRAAIGASGLDGALAMAVDEENIDLRAFVLTDRGVEYKGLRVTGPLDALVVKPGPIMTGALGRISDGMVNLGWDGLKTGVNVAEGGIEVMKELGTGAVDLGVNLGKSLFSATAGLVTLDKDKVKQGASGTTRGTFDITKDSVKGSGKAAGDSMKKSTRELTGEGRVKAWEHDIPARYEASMEHARTVLAEMPYPPVTE